MNALDNNRQLTPAEQRRKEVFDAKCEEMYEKGYTKSDLTFSVTKANMYAVIIMLPFLIGFMVWFFVVNLNRLSFHYGLIDFLILIVCMVLLTIIHELIHGITWATFANRHFKSIEFGVVWKMLTPYCTCSDTLTKLQYIIGAAMPTIIVGIIPAIIAIYCNHFLLFLVFWVLIAGGGGDALIILKILQHRSKGKECVYLDIKTLGLIQFNYSSADFAA